MAIRKSECLDCGHVYPKKGNSVCTECESDNVTAYSPNYEDHEAESIQDALDQFELRDFYDRRKGNS